MGYNTGVLLLNDSQHVMVQNPQGFVENLNRAIGQFHHGDGDPQDFAIGNHVNGGRVFHVAHADEVGVFAIGGNHTSQLARIWNGGRHHEHDEQVRLLKQIADNLGYRVSRKPGT